MHFCPFFNIKSMKTLFFFGSLFFFSFVVNGQTIADLFIRNGKIYVGEEIAMLLLEVKKTDSNCIYFNDTCPSSQANYIIISTGKIYSSAKRPELLPAVYGINGSDIIASSPWLLDFKRDIDALKEKYRETEGIMTVYPRPTYKANMDIIFKEHYETAKIAKLD